MNYYERHLGDYAKDTGHLSLLEHGVYTLLLDRYYATEKPIPADQAYRLARARTRAEQRAVDAVLDEYFTLHDGRYHCTRADEEIEKKNKRALANQENGRRGGRPKKENWVDDEKPDQNPEQTQAKPNDNPDQNPIKTQTEPKQNPTERQPVTSNQKPVTKHQKPEKATATAKATNIPSSDNLQIPELLQDSDCLRTNCAKNAQSALTKTDSEKIALPEKTEPKPKPESTRAPNPLSLKPDDVNERAWCDFITLRRAKKAPISETAMKRFRVQVEKAGISMQTAIEICCAQGWQGFNAEWYANLNRSNAKRSNDPEDIYEHNRKVGEAWLAEQQRKPAPLITGHPVIYDPLADAARRRAQAPLALTNGIHHA